MNTDSIELVIDSIEERVRQVLNLATPSKIYVEVERDSCPVRSKRYTDPLKGSKT